MWRRQREDERLRYVAKCTVERRAHAEARKRRASRPALPSLPTGTSLPASASSPRSGEDAMSIASIELLAALVRVLAAPPGRARRPRDRMPTGLALRHGDTRS